MALSIVNGLEVYQNGSYAMYRCTGCKCWRHKEDKKCSICQKVRVALPGDGPTLPLNAEQRRARTINYADSIRKMDAEAKSNKLSK